MLNGYFACGYQQNINMSIDNMKTCVLELVATHPKSALAIIGSALSIYYLYRRPRNLPPGPPWYPLIGSQVDFTKRPYEYWADMSEKYGDIVSYCSREGE